MSWNAAKQIHFWARLQSDFTKTLRSIIRIKFEQNLRILEETNCVKHQIMCRWMDVSRPYSWEWVPEVIQYINRYHQDTNFYFCICLSGGIRYEPKIHNNFYIMCNYIMCNSHLDIVRRRQNLKKWIIESFPLQRRTFSEESVPWASRVRECHRQVGKNVDEGISMEIKS